MAKSCWFRSRCETVDEEESEADGYEGAQALEYQVTVTAPEWNKNHMG
ncbi:MAG: hypothetical protein ACLUGJ_00130 [Blautia wexlerae]